MEPTCFYKFTKFCQILILTLWFLTLPCFLAKIAQILQKVVVFFLERGDEIEPWFWHILITQWLTAYIFRFWPSSGETFGQSWTKSANFGSVSFLLIFQFIFNQCFFARAPPLKFLSPEVALYLYKSTIRSCMEYCCHVWLVPPVATWNC